MRKSDWLAQLPDELIEKRKRLFPNASAFARVLGISRHKLLQREKTMYHSIGPVELAETLRALENQSKFSPGSTEVVKHS